jgi:hypothetical protein
MVNELLSPPPCPVIALPARHGHSEANLDKTVQWMHCPREWYEREKNPRNCSVQLIEGRAGSGYSDRLVFDGFEHARESPQARREEGRVG